MILKCLFTNRYRFDKISLVQQNLHYMLAVLEYLRSVSRPIFCGLGFDSVSNCYDLGPGLGLYVQRLHDPADTELVFRSLQLARK